MGEYKKKIDNNKIYKEVHASKMAKLKNSELPLIKKNDLHVYQEQELYVAIK